MSKSTKGSRPNRKLTEFFDRQPKATGEPQPLEWHTSASVGRPSMIPVPDEAFLPSKLPEPVQSTRMHDGACPNSSRQAERVLPASKSWEIATNNVSVASRSPFKGRAATPVEVRKNRENTKNAKNAKKRKQQPVNLITSEESDDPVLPSIHVRLHSKKDSRLEGKADPQPSTPLTSTCSSAVTPLTPRQNLISPSDRSLQGDDIVVAARTSPLLKRGVPPPMNPVTPTRHRPSPPKRARHNSFLSDQLTTLPAPGEVDKSKAQVNTSSPKRFCGTSQSTLPAQKLGQKHVLLMDNIISPVSTPLGLIPDSCVKDAHREVSDDSEQFAVNTIQYKEMREIILSSQQDETELLTDHDAMSTEPTDMSRRAATVRTEPKISPGRIRTNDIIARIKAKAEAEAAAQAQEECTRSSLGMLGSDESELWSLSSLSSDEEDAGLEFELGAYGKNSTASSNRSLENEAAGVAGTGVVGTQEAPPRRSVRNADLPAPNYAKKLVLFRDEDASSDEEKHGVNGKVIEKGKGKSKVVVCPLDRLLKDCERESARKARAEKKRKENVTSSQYPSTSSFDPHASVLESDGHGSPSSFSSMESDDDDDCEDPIMSPTARRELLGKEAAKAVGKILRNDRKSQNIVEKQEGGVYFWSMDVEGDIDIVPAMAKMDYGDPFVLALSNALDSGDYAMASLLIDSRALGSVPPLAPVIEWLFLTATSAVNHGISESAFRALLVLHREVSSTHGVAYGAQLSSAVILAPLFKLGVNPQIVQLLTPAGEKDTSVSVVRTSREMRMEIIYRFITMLEVLGRCQSVEPMAIPSVVTAILLLSLDYLAVSELQQDAVHVIEAMLASLNITRDIELSTCKFVLDVTRKLSFTPDLYARLLALIPGCSPSSRRIRRWIAWATLGGDLLSIEQCADAPPMESMLNLFSPMEAAAPNSMKLQVTQDTDYELLGMMVDILSVAMTDIGLYVRLENGDAMTKDMCEALARLNGKIVDTRAAHIERTRTKEVINRLHKRLVYQRHAALGASRIHTGKLDNFLITKVRSDGDGGRSDRIAKPAPVPVR